MEAFLAADELRRELGDADGPLLVAAVATLTTVTVTVTLTLTHGYAALAVLLAAGAAIGLARRHSGAAFQALVVRRL